MGIPPGCNLDMTAPLGGTTQGCSLLFRKYWKQHSTKHLLYGHLSPISQTIQVRQDMTVEEVRMTLWVMSLKEEGAG